MTAYQLLTAVKLSQTNFDSRNTLGRYYSNCMPKAYCQAQKNSVRIKVTAYQLLTAVKLSEKNFLSGRC